LTDVLSVEDAHGVSAVLLAQRIHHTDTCKELMHYCQEVRHCYNLLSVPFYSVTALVAAQISNNFKTLVT
jgi:hypothetical protein